MLSNARKRFSSFLSLNNHREKEKERKNGDELYPATGYGPVNLVAAELRPEDSQGRWGDSGATVFQRCW